MAQGMGMKVSKIALQSRRIFSLKKQDSSQSSPTQGKDSVQTTRKTRFFSIIVEAEDEESNIRLMESAIRLAEALQLPAGCQVRATYELSAEIAQVLINM
jgi:hypothetical protein